MGLHKQLFNLPVLKVQRTTAVFPLVVRTGYGRKTAVLYTMAFRFFNQSFKKMNMGKEVLWKQ